MENASSLKMRYARQIAVPDIGIEGQNRLIHSKVLIIGCGALGSMVAMQLAGAGIGVLGLVDFDTVDVSNLQRQFFFKSSEAGEPKLKLLSRALKELNPEVKIEEHPFVMTAEKANGLFGVYDVIIDATDNPESKKITGEISRLKSVACCIGGVRDFRGQITTLLPEDGRFEEYFGSASSEGFMPCSLGGVMGTAAAFCATIQANEAIKYLTGKGDLLSGKFFYFDLLNNNFRIFSLI